MARLIDVMKKREEISDANGFTPLVAVEDAFDPPVAVEDAFDPPAAAVEVEAFPYIELDGATRTLAASPDVLPGPVALSPQPTPILSAPIPPVAVTAEVDSSVLTYQPWSATSASAIAARIAPELVVYHQPEQPGSRQYRQLLGKLLQCERPPQVLVFTSRTSDVKSAIPVLNLAIAAGQDRARQVAVVAHSDAVSGCLDLPCAPGLQQVLAGRIALEQALQTSPITNLSVLSFSRESNAQGLPWNRDALHWVANWLRSRFQLIFIDVGTWEASPEQVLLATLADAVFPIFQDAGEQQASGQQFARSLLGHGGPVRGWITAGRQ
jgi:hypothetical protein